MAINIESCSTTALGLISAAALAGAAASGLGLMEVKALEGTKFLAVLGVAVLVVLMFRDRLNKFNFLGISGELTQVKQSIDLVAAKTEALSTQTEALSTRTEQLNTKAEELKTLQVLATAPKEELAVAGSATAQASAESDPNKGQFGGKAIRDGLILSAAVTDAIGHPGYFRVDLSVAAQGGLRDLVEFHLHDSFHPPVQVVKPVGNEAQLTLLSYGAFTVGAVIGPTRLELDLAENPSFPSAFRAS